MAYAERLGLRVRLVEFPPWNDELYSLVRNMLYFYVSADESGRGRFLDLVWSATVATLRRVPSLLERYHAVFWYTPYIDVASHLYYRPRCPRCMLRLRAAYKRLERLVAETLSNLPGDTEVLIVSDHGYNPRVQDHSHYGYWSSTSAPVKPSRAEEVADLIRELARAVARGR